MTTNIAINRGSEWRKWDLHVHTPETKLNNQYNAESNVWREFCKRIEKSDVDVFGITDYFSLENYTKFINEFLQIYPNSTKVFFPNIEFRIADKNKDGEHIQFHIIFSNQEEIVNKIPQFLTRLPLISTDDINLTKKYCCKEDLEKIGYKKAMVRFEETISTLEENFSLHDYIIVGLSSGYGSLRPGKDDTKGGEYAKEIDKKCGVFFGSSKDTDFYLNKIPGRDSFNLPPKPVFNGSDSHSFAHIDNKLGKKYEKKDGKGSICDYSEITWVKAEPTFEGLRQTIYEPEERVRIQENNPKLDYDKPYFSSIFFRNDENIFKDEELYFDKSTQEIPLNPNLVAIIGGRGEGKSMLMKYISTSFAIKTIETDKYFLKSGNIEVKYSKTIKNEEEFLPFPIINNTKHSLDFIYISQGELKNIVEKKEQLAEGISKMADIKEIAFDKNLDKEVSDKLEELHNIVVFLEDSQNNLEKLQEQENTQRQFIENITTKENKEKLEQYTKILGDINIETDKKIQLLNLKNIFSQEEINLNGNITSINQKYSLDIPTIQKEQIFKLQLEKIQELLKSIEEHFISLNQEKERIKNEFSQFYTGDLTTLLKDVDKYQNELSLISDKIERVNEAIEKKRNLIKVIFEDIENQLSLISKIKAEYNEQEKSILEDWEKFKNIGLREDLNSQQKRIMQTLLQDLDIEAVTEFNKEAFYNEIYHCINGAGWRIKNNQKAQEEYFGINDLDSFFNFLKEKYLEASSINGIHRDVLRATLFNEQYRQKYIKVYPILKYKGKNLDKISIGQKGTVYLKMKLATEAFSKPIVFDQPEDDLDNQFIIKELVDLFKELKKYRQVIIITHNANLVINADAEQVIIAKNDNERLKYYCGSLENSNINKQICEILEGGKEAFEKREQKYNF